MRRDEFAAFNPITNIVFFAFAICMGMFILHPVFTLCSFVCAIIYCFLQKGIKAIKYVLFLLGTFVFLSVINPLFNTAGHIVLFTWIANRPYTLEALMYGMQLGGMVVSVLCWFSCYNAAVSSDKFIWILGKASPSLSVVLTMILRLIPHLKEETLRLQQARAGIGLAGESSLNKRERIRNSATILSALTARSMENSIVMSASMKARGYGTGKRSSYQDNSFDRANIVCMTVIFLLAAVTVFCAACGGTKASYLPEIDISWFGNIYTLAGHISYTLMLLIPAFINIKERIKWQILRSRI